MYVFDLDAIVPALAFEKIVSSSEDLVIRALSGLRTFATNGPKQYLQGLSREVGLLI